MLCPDAEDKAAEMHKSASFVQRLLLAIQQILGRGFAQVILGDEAEPIVPLCAS